MNKLFTFLFSSCLVALVLATNPDFIQQRDAAKELCKKEQNVGDDVADIMESKKNQLPSSEAEQCFLECYYIKFGMIKDGKFDFQGGLAYAQSKFGINKDNFPQLETFFRSCEANVPKFSGEKCGIGKALRQCFAEHGSKYPIYPKSS